MVSLQALTSQLEKDWLVTLAALKRKDPKIYQKEVKFYHEATGKRKCIYISVTVKLTRKV